VLGSGYVPVLRPWSDRTKDERTEDGLVAYNDGPGYARRYARGQAALYGVTRDYLRKVLSNLSANC
jgi:streptomycin 6-kinase